jgi:hypothetical protein
MGATALGALSTGALVAGAFAIEEERDKRPPRRAARARAMKARLSARKLVRAGFPLLGRGRIAGFL